MKVKMKVGLGVSQSLKTPHPGVFILIRSQSDMLV